MLRLVLRRSGCLILLLRGLCLICLLLLGRMDMGKFISFQLQPCFELQVFTLASGFGLRLGLCGECFY